MNQDDPKVDPRPKPPQQKQSYTPPVLRVEGRIEALTQAVSGDAVDGLGGSIVL